MADILENKTWREKSKYIGQRREIQKTLGQGHIIHTQDRLLKNSEIKLYYQVGGECTWTNQKSNAKEEKQFWSKLW